jgi:hypothetical protein
MATLLVVVSMYFHFIFDSFGTGGELCKLELLWQLSVLSDSVDLLVWRGFDSWTRRRFAVRAFLSDRPDAICLLYNFTSESVDELFDSPDLMEPHELLFLICLFVSVLQAPQREAFDAVPEQLFPFWYLNAGCMQRALETIAQRMGKMGDDTSFN